MYLPEKYAPKLSKDETYFGIDLGTTYTLVATVDSKEVNSENILEVPVKFISYDQRSPRKHDGAIQDEKVASILAMSNGKPYCGSNLYDLKGQENFQKNHNIFYHWKLDFGLDRHPLYPNAVSLELDTPAKVAGKLLNFCRIGYTKNRNQRLFNTVITVPASFQMNQRDDVIQAAEYANIDHDKRMLIDEPNAAFIGFFNQLDQSEKERFLPTHNKKKQVLIFDIGGGTCDLSIIEVGYSPQKGMMMGNKAISRYNDIAGQDIDMLIAEDILYPLFLDTFDFIDDIPYRDLTDTILPQLATIGEKLKKGICNLVATKYPSMDFEPEDLKDIVYQLEGRKIDYKNEEFEFQPLKISAKKFSELLDKLFRKHGYKFKYQDKFVRSIGKSVNEILEKANLNKHDIDVFLPVGGSSKNPMLINRIQNMFTKTNYWAPAKPDKLVAEGAAVYSFFYYRFGKPLINAISSETIGIKVKGGTIYPLIEKGEELPTEQSVPDFNIQSVRQEEIIIPVCLKSIEHVVQEIKIPLKKMYAGNETVTIKAKLNANKVLSLEIQIDGDDVGNYTLENPFFFGSSSKKEESFDEITRELDEARRTNDNNTQRRLMLDLLRQYYRIENYHEVARLSNEYLEKFDSENTTALNYSYLGNHNIGRIEAAKQALEKAIKLEPKNSSFRYNYSILLSETEGAQSSLDYLLDLPAEIRRDTTIQCRIAILKSKLGKDGSEQAKELAEKYQDDPNSFSQFEKDHLLSKVHNIAGANYSQESKIESEKHKKLLVASHKPKIKK